MSCLWNQLRLKTCSEILELYRLRLLSPVEVVQTTLARVSSLDPKVNAFVVVDEGSALKQAHQSEQRWMDGNPQGLLDGIPGTVKDLLDIKGWPTRYGSRLPMKLSPASEDAPAVARLQENGVIFLGKTTTPEFGWKCVSDSPLTGTTRNPWNLALTPGGSSGGAAVAAALGFGFLHVGTDGGGSIRVPASMTGVVGFKPTYGRIPSYPRSHNDALLHVGTLTRNVSDSALMMSVMCRPDARDWNALPYDNQDYCQKLNVSLTGKKVAFCGRFGKLEPSPEITAVTRKAAFSFEQLGAIVDEIEWLFDLQEVFTIFWQAAIRQLLKSAEPSEMDKIDPGLLALRKKSLEIDIDNYFYALQKRAEFGKSMNLLFQTYDYLITPTLPILPFVINQDTPSSSAFSEWIDWTPFSYPFNLSGQPALSIPCGLSQSGLPIGLQVVSARFQDLEVLQAGKAFETLQDSILADHSSTKL